MNHDTIGGSFKVCRYVNSAAVLEEPWHNHSFTWMLFICYKVPQSHSAIPETQSEWLRWLKLRILSLEQWFTELCVDCPGRKAVW
jgi:hypothetical protein